MKFLLDTCVWGGASNEHGEDLKSGAIITVEANRLRIRLRSTQEK